MVTHAELHELLSARRSVRRFRSEPPPREVIESLIASAVTAPSASNKQPWRFLVVQRRAAHRGHGRAVRAAVDRIARAIDPAFEESFRAYGDYFTRFENAPLVIVPLFRPLTVLSNLIADGDDGRDSGDGARLGADRHVAGDRRTCCSPRTPRASARRA